MDPNGVTAYGCSQVRRHHCGGPAMAAVVSFPAAPARRHPIDRLQPAPLSTTSPQVVAGTNWKVRLPLPLPPAAA